jgi:hypothetical protein
VFLRVTLRPDALDHQRCAVARFEGLQQAQRVLALEHPAVVEGKQEQEPLRQSEICVVRGLEPQRKRHPHHRHRGYSGQGVCHVVRAHPHLVHQVERAHESLREGVHLPPPESDRIAALEEIGAELVVCPFEPVRVDAHQVHGVRRRVGPWRRPAGQLLGTSPDQAEAGHRDPGSLEAAADLTSGLPDPQHGIEIAGKVHTDGELRWFLHRTAVRVTATTLLTR